MDFGVARKVALVAPAGTETDAGTVKLALLLDKLAANPPVAAAPVSVTVQVEVAGEATDDGLQVTAPRLATTDGPTMVPAEPVVTSWAPVSEEAKVFETPTVAELTPEGIVTLTTAIVPLAISVLFIP